MPISAVALPGYYAEIHAIGGMGGWFTTYSGYKSSLPLLPLYRVLDDTSVTVEPPAKLSYRTKKRLEAWLKRAYPQRHRPPKVLPGICLSWAELFGASSTPQDFTNLGTNLIEALVSEAKGSLGELSPDELEALRADAQNRFVDTLRIYRKRRRRALNRALADKPRLFVLTHPLPVYYLCAGRLTCFRRCVIFWNKKGEERGILPELPFTADGEVTFP